MLDNKRMTPLIAILGAAALMMSAPAFAQDTAAPATDPAAAATTAPAADAAAAPVAEAPVEATAAPAAPKKSR
ncbi:MAG: flagellar motor protein MotA, partial [Caulobacter sp.]|nr:flagellar motor protein MotA [Caulobacter sp.]